MHRLAVGAACILVAACAGTVKEGMAKLRGSAFECRHCQDRATDGRAQHCGEESLLLGYARAVVQEQGATMPNPGNNER
jgi:hypothetical protein